MSTCVHTGLLLAASVALGSCALRSADVRPVAADAMAFGGWTCEQLFAESDRVQRQATRMAYAFDERSGDNIIAMGLGLTVFWPALLSMRSPGPEAQQLGALKGRHEALREAASRQACVRTPWRVPGDSPLDLRDTLTYEQRDSPRARPRRLQLQLVAWSGERAEWQSAAPAEASAGAGTAVWRHDRYGNLSEAPQGPVWPQLLRGELALGELVHGELVDATDGTQRARVRGQVMAIGPQDVGGRRFDAAVIELFGDAPMGDARTRLDGALVVDRGSGLLLRLDLESASPAFRLQRRLVRIERPVR